jgi:hypothetical protein
MIVVSGADSQGASIPIRGCTCTVSRTHSPTIAALLLDRQREDEAAAATSALSAQIRPPCSSTRRLESTSPRPVPSRCSTPTPTCWNSSKIRSSSSRAKCAERWLVQAMDISELEPTSRALLPIRKRSEPRVERDRSLRSITLQQGEMRLGGFKPPTRGFSRRRLSKAPGGRSARSRRRRSGCCSAAGSRRRSWRRPLRSGTSCAR